MSSGWLRGGAVIAVCVVALSGCVQDQQSRPQASAPPAAAEGTLPCPYTSPTAGPQQGVQLRIMAGEHVAIDLPTPASGARVTYFTRDCTAYADQNAIIAAVKTQVAAEVRSIPVESGPPIGSLRLADINHGNIHFAGFPDADQVEAAMRRVGQIEGDEELALLRRSGLFSSVDLGAWDPKAARFQAPGTYDFDLWPTGDGWHLRARDGRVVSFLKQKPGARQIPAVDWIEAVRTAAKQLAQGQS
jgi:hypothetical protein